MPHALIVDDSKAMRMLLRRCLDPTGYSVGEAADGEEALLALAQGEPVKLILLDWNMPRMDGITFLKKVRSDDRHQDTRIVMVTCEADQDHLEQALAEGADEYIMKPLIEEVVTEKLLLLTAGSL